MGLLVLIALSLSFGRVLFSMNPNRSHGCVPNPLYPAVPVASIPEISWLLSPNVPSGNQTRHAGKYAIGFIDFPTHLPFSSGISHLVGGLEPWNFMTLHILGMSSSQVTNSYFQRG